MTEFYGNNNMLLEGFGVKLTSIVKADIEQIRQWRNHPDISQYMFDTISKEQQNRWFESLSRRDDLCYLLISYKDTKMGVINAHSADSSKLSLAINNRINIETA